MKLLLNKEEMLAILSKKHEETKAMPRETVQDLAEAIGASAMISAILTELESYD